MVLRNHAYSVAYGKKEWRTQTRDTKFFAIRKSIKKFKKRGIGDFYSAFLMNIKAFMVI